jgi:hypothetical protein
MRTTLTIEPDVAQKLKRKMAQTGLSLKETINSALRTGLTAVPRKARTPRFRVEPHASGFLPGIDRDRMNQLADQLEAEAALRKRPR